MANNYQRKVAIVTGSYRGIGYEIVSLNSAFLIEHKFQSVFIKGKRAV
jgi:hypothetical protein